MISITEKAADHIKGQLSQRGKGLGIRLGVKTTGCSGLAYVIEFADSENDDDNVFLDKGIKLIVNPKSYVYLKGTEVDFAKEAKLCRHGLLRLVLELHPHNPYEFQFD